MKKIKIFLPHAEIKINVTDEMVRDFKECKELAEDITTDEYKDCDTCSWGRMLIGCTGLCEAVSEEQVIGGTNGTSDT